MTTKYTQGPWKATKCTMREGFIIGQNGVAVVGSVKRKLHGGAIQNIAHVGPDEANARLIAAAPELLAIVQKYLDSADKPMGMSDIADIDAEARVIVAKAKGE